MVRTDRFTSEIVQAALAEYFSEGWYDAYFRKIARTYDAKRRLILELCASSVSRTTSSCSTSFPSDTPTGTRSKMRNTWDGCLFQKARFCTGDTLPCCRLVAR